MRRVRSLTTRMSRAAERLERYPLAIGLAMLALAAFLSYLSVIAIHGVPFQDRYRVEAVVPADAPLLKDGDEVRAGGQRVGQVREVSLGRRGAHVEMELTEGFVGRGARAKVRLRGLSGAVYVQLERGDTAHPLPEGSVIPRSRTSSGVELQDVVNQFDRDTRLGLRRTLRGYGAGLLGRGEDLNATLDDLPPTLRGATPLLDAFTPGVGQLSELLRELRQTARAAAPPGSGDFELLVPAAAETFDALTARSTELAAALDFLRPFEDEALRVLPFARPLLSDLESVAATLTPGVRELARTTPDLNALLADGPLLAELSRLARRARPVLQPAEPLMRELRPGAAALAPLALPLEPFSRTLIPYQEELIGGPEGFRQWGRYFYDAGSSEDGFPHRGVRFSIVLTCHPGREPYPAPGAATKQSEPC